MEIQQTHRKINRPLVSLALVGLLVSITPQKSHAAFFTTVIIPAIVGGIATGAAVGTVSGLLGWGLKQAEEANKTPDKPDKVWRIQAGRGFNEFPNKEYDLYKSLLSSKIDGGWDWGNAARHYWVKGGQWNKLEVDMKDAVGIYKLSGLRNYTGGDLDVNMQKATLRLGQFNGNSFTSFKDSADRTTRVDFNAKNILIDNFLEINNRVGSGAGRKASSTVLTLQASEGITSDKNAEISLYDGATLNLASNSVKLMGNVWMGRLQYVGAYLAPSYSTINTSKVTGEVNFNHLTVGDRNAAQAGIIASNKTYIGTLDLWQSAGLNIIAPQKAAIRINLIVPILKVALKTTKMKALKTTSKIVTLRSLTHPIADKKQKFNPRKSLMGLLLAPKTRWSISTASTLTLMAQLKWEGIQLLLPPMRLI